MEEAELIQLARQGDLGAFNELILKYQNQVFNHAFHFLADDHAAEDVTQDAFLRGFQNFYQFRGVANWVG